MLLRELYEEDENPGDVAEAEGFEKSTDRTLVSGSYKRITYLTKEEKLGGLNVELQYVINPETGSWIFKAGLAENKSRTEFASGEDVSSLIKHLKKKKKISTQQAVDYFNPEKSVPDKEEAKHDEDAAEE